MFPMIHADVFDARPKDTKLWHNVPGKACTMIQRPFEMKDASGYADINSRVVFVSDTRSVSRATEPGKVFTVKNSDILADLWLQEEWTERMKPRQTLLKFRMPFESDEPVLQYLDGDMYVQPFTARSSTEVRLHVKQRVDGAFAKRKYDCIAHEEVSRSHEKAIGVAPGKTVCA